MRRKESGQPITSCLHNKRDQPIQNKPKKILNVIMNVTTDEIIHLNSKVILCIVVFIKYYNIIFL